ATAMTSSAPTSRRIAAPRHWAACGPSWTSFRTAARRSGRNLPRAGRRARRMSGGIGTTSIDREAYVVRFFTPVRIRVPDDPPPDAWASMLVLTQSSPGGGLGDGREIAGIDGS